MMKNDQLHVWYGIWSKEESLSVLLINCQFGSTASIFMIIDWKCNLCVYYTIPFGFSLFTHFWAQLFNVLNYFVQQRITDRGSVPEMHIWSILLIKSDLKWCMHLSRSLFLYFSHKRDYRLTSIDILMRSVLWAPMSWKGVFYVTQDTGPSLALQSVERWNSNLSLKYYFLM